MRFRIRDDKLRRFPPHGGWKYREAKTGWEAPRPLIDDYYSTVKRIVEHREANPEYGFETSPDAAASDLEQQTAERILSETPRSAADWVLPLDDEAKKKTGVAKATDSPRRVGCGFCGKRR